MQEMAADIDNEALLGCVQVHEQGVKTTKSIKIVLSESKSHLSTSCGRYVS